ncbi:MAG: sigma-70 family RNA polymerase sigma factor [Phycisphaerae bacterium]
MNDSAAETTGLLRAMTAGDPSAGATLLPLVYDALHGIASRYLRQERPGHTLQPTALVHEVYLRLVGSGDVGFRGRAHFLAVAGAAMRNILVNHALARRAAKRGGGARPAGIEVEPPSDGPPVPDVVALHDALGRLAALDARKAQVVEQRFFGGMTTAEIAIVLGCSVSTVEADWRMARAWLSSELSEEC